MTTADSTQPATPRTRYDTGAIAFHWLIAAAVLLNIGLGLYMGDLPRGDPMKFAIISLHKSIGLTVLVLSVAWVVWRLTHRVPALPAGMSAGLKLAARATHIVLYTLIVALPLSGWMMVSTSPRGAHLPYFGLFEWPAIGPLASMATPDKKALIGGLAESHEILAWTMIALVSLHVVAALWHQFVRRDGLMTQMRPGG